jgi:hypothetical protein
VSVVFGVDPSLTISGCATVRFGQGEDAAEPLWETWRGRGVPAEVVNAETSRRRIRLMLTEILALAPSRITLSVVEGPAMAAKYTPLADERAGLRWLLIDQLLSRGPVVLVSPNSRQSLTGVGVIPRGTSKTKRKRLVTDAVRALVPAAHIPDDNVGDAVALAAAGAHRVGLLMPYTAKQERTHSNVEWPVESGAAASGMEKEA